MAGGANCCVKFVVYLLVFYNIVGGILFLVVVNYQSHQDDYYLTSFSPSVSNISTGIISICLGFLLLCGAVKKNAECVLLYLLLMIIGSVSSTGITLTFCIVVTFGSDPGWFVLLYIGLMVTLWAMVYCVYLFHKSLVEESDVLNFDAHPPDYKEEMA